MVRRCSLAHLAGWFMTIGVPARLLAFERLFWRPEINARLSFLEVSQTDGTRISEDLGLAAFAEKREFLRFFQSFLQDKLLQNRAMAKILVVAIAADADRNEQRYRGQELDEAATVSALHLLFVPTGKRSKWHLVPPIRRNKVRRGGKERQPLIKVAAALLIFASDAARDVPRHAEAQPFAVAARRTITIGRNGRRHVLKENQIDRFGKPGPLINWKNWALRTSLLPTRNRDQWPRLSGAIFLKEQLPGGRCGRDRRHLEKISKVFSLPA
jgi:hypothetical protein